MLKREYRLVRIMAHLIMDLQPIMNAILMDMEKLLTYIVHGNGVQEHFQIRTYI